MSLIPASANRPELEENVDYSLQDAKSFNRHFGRANIYGGAPITTKILGGGLRSLHTNSLRLRVASLERFVDNDESFYFQARPKPTLVHSIRDPLIGFDYRGIHSLRGLFRRSIEEVVISNEAYTDDRLLTIQHALGHHSPVAVHRSDDGVLQASYRTFQPNNSKAPNNSRWAREVAKAAYSLYGDAPANIKRFREKSKENLETEAFCEIRDTGYFGSDSRRFYPRIPAQRFSWQTENLLRPATAHFQVQGVAPRGDIVNISLDLRLKLTNSGYKGEYAGKGDVVIVTDESQGGVSALVANLFPKKSNVRVLHKLVADSKWSFTPVFVSSEELEKRRQEVLSRVA